MYTLNAILVGVEENSLPNVRRELTNCSVDIDAEFASVSVAMAALRNERSKRRLLIYRIISEQDIDPLSQLTKSLAGWPVLALFDRPDDPTSSAADTLIGFMRAGVSQFVPFPLRATDFREALDRIDVQLIHDHAQAQIIAIGGVTGGCGATTISINLADEIAYGHGLRCILVDLSLRMGKVAAYLDVVAPYSILNLLSDVRRVDALMVEKALVPVAEGFKILAGPTELAGSVSVPPREVAHLINTLSQITDVVVIDVPCTYDDLYFETLATARQTVLVGEQTLTSVRALQLVYRTLGETRKVDGSDQVVINRNDPRNSTFSVDCLLKPIGVSSLLTIARDDAAVCAALHKGRPIRLVSPGSKALADIVTLTRTLLSPEAPPPTTSSRGLFSQMRRPFSKHLRINHAKARD